MMFSRFQCLLAISVALPLSSIAEDAPVSFSRQILPLLKANCVACHKPGKTKGGLDLTAHASLIKGDKHGSILNVANTTSGPLLDSISGDEPDMPKEGEPLSLVEVTLIKQWVSQGAKNDSAGPLEPPIPSEPPKYKFLPSITALAWSPDGALLAVPGRNEILLYGNGGTQLAARLLGASTRLEALTFSSDGQRLVASGGIPSELGEIQIWDVAKRAQLRSIKASSDSLYGVSLSSDGKQVAVGCADKLVRVFAMEDGKERMKCDNHIDWVFGTAFTKDGRSLTTVSRDKASKLINIQTGQLIDDVNRPRDALICLARHPTEDQIVTGGSEGRMRMFKMEPRGGRLAEGDDKENSFVREFEALGSPIQSVAFSADGTLVASGAMSGEVRVFKTENSQRVSILKGKFGPIFALAFQPGTSVLAAAGQDGKIRLYDSKTGEMQKEFDSVPVGH